MLRLPLLALAALLASCATTGGTSAPTGNGKSLASDFTLKSVDGQSVSLSDYLGKKVIVLDFCATWCQPCTQALPHLVKLYEAKKDQGLMVLGISMDGPETVANLGPYVRTNAVTFPMLIDDETRAVSLYNPRRSAPLMVFIDRKGTIAEQREGYIQGDEKAVEATVARLLAEANAPVAAEPAKAEATPAAVPNAGEGK